MLTVGIQLHDDVEAVAAAVNQSASNRGSAAAIDRMDEHVVRSPAASHVGGLVG